MLYYQPRGLSAERSYIQRKAHMISFFSHLFDHKGIKFIKHTKFTIYINYQKFCQNFFMELNTLRFKIENNATEKMG